MSSRPFQNATPDERAIFRRVADGTVTPKEFLELESRLIEDAGFRERYVLHMGLEADLYEEISELPVTVARHDAGRREPAGQSSASRWPWFVAACSLLLGISSGVVTHFTLGPKAAPVAMESSPSSVEALPATVAPTASSTINPADLAATGTSKSVPGIAANAFPPGPVTWTPTSTAGSSPAIAMITDLEIVRAENEPAPLTQGQRLAAGRLEVQEGRVQIEFINGAQVLLEGPAVLQVESELQATLVSGRAAARVPDSARGFVLNSPGAAVVDLGTEFAVTIDEQGRSEVQVTDGEVEVSLLGADGNTIQSERLKNQQSVRVLADSQQFDALPKRAAPPLQIPKRVSPTLKVTDEYVNSVIGASPFAYWRFEEFDGKQVRNQMGEQFAAVFVNHNEPDSIVVGDGRVTFHASSRPRYFSVDGGIPGWNSREFTIELWACPDRLHHGAIIDMLSEDWSGDLNTIELAMKTAMIHPPGAFRFFHRHPPGQSAKSGINFFDHVTCVPGQWYHLVATKSPGSLAFYINGRLVRRIDGPTGSDDNTYQLVLGQMDHRMARQFEGSVDEVALYDRALSADEVAEHTRHLKSQFTAEMTPSATLFPSPIQKVIK